MSITFGDPFWVALHKASSFLFLKSYESKRSKLLEIKKPKLSFRFFLWAMRD